MSDHQQKKGAPLPGRWPRAAQVGLTLGAATLLYLTLLLVLKWDFLPAADVYVLDVRWPVCSSVDKLDELKSSQEMGNSLGRDLQQLWYFYSGQPVSPKRMDFNPLPKVIIWLLSQVLAPVLAYNATLVLIWLLNGLVICGLVFYLTRVRSAGLLGGLVFAFSPLMFSVQHCRSLDYGMFFLVPLAVLLLALVRDRGGWGWVVALGLNLFALVLSHQYYAMGMGVIVIPWLVLVLLSPGPLGRRRALIRLVAAGLCALVLAGPWLIFEWKMLQIQQSMMEARDTNVGRSFFRALSVTEDLGLAWTIMTASLAALGLALAGRARLGERLVFAALAALLVGAQHLISENAYATAMLLQDTVLWRVRACRLSGTLVVCFGAILAGIGWGALITRLPWFWLRALLGLAAVAGCVLFLTEDLRWWERVRVHVPPLSFPRATIERIKLLGPDPRVYAISLTPRLNMASYAGTFLEIQAEASRGPSEMEQHLQQMVRKKMGLRMPGSPSDPHQGPAARRMLSEGELHRRCNVVVVRGGVGREATPSPGRALAALGFTRILHEGQGWTIAHNRRCR